MNREAGSSGVSIEDVYRTESRAVLATLIRTALRRASKIPPAAVGSVEVRPSRPIREQPRPGAHSR